MKKIFYAMTLLLAMLVSCGEDEGLSNNDNNDNNAYFGNRKAVTIDSNYTYELPVIFHVLYKDGSDDSQYIPYMRLANILSYVNMIYEGHDFGESENIHVKFVLAKEDERGNKLRYPGVEYIRYTVGEYPIDPFTFMSDNTGKNAKYLWDPNRYINVMMYNFKQTSDTELTLGVSHMPYSAPGHEIEGLSKSPYATLKKDNLSYPYSCSINSLYAGTIPQSLSPSLAGGYFQSDRYTNKDHKATYLNSADIVVTMAHELGHYLGLFHAFTDAQSDDDSVEAADSCADTDYCTDTKSYNRHEYQEYIKYLNANQPDATLEQMLRRNACDGTEYISANIMDYNWTLGYKISKEQKARILNVLYYSPLIPGPKKNATTRASEAPKGKVDLKMTIIK